MGVASVILFLNSYPVSMSCDGWWSIYLSSVVDLFIPDSFVFFFTGLVFVGAASIIVYLSQFVPGTVSYVNHSIIMVNNFYVHMPRYLFVPHIHVNYILIFLESIYRIICNSCN